MTKTGRVAELNVHEPRALLDMHPSDADRRRLQPGDLVEIRSEMGDGIFPVRITADIAQGVVFLPMHQGAFFRSGGMTNELVFPDTDPISRQPEFKRIPIAVHPARLGSFGTIMTAGNNLTPGRDLLATVPYGNLFLHGSPPLTVAEYALRERCDEDGERFDAIIAGWIDNSQTLLYRDDRRGDYKRVWMRQGRLIAIHQIAEKPADFRSCLPLFSQETAALEKSVREWFHGAGGGATPSYSPLAPRWGKLSATVCVCMGVDEERLSAAIAQGARTVKEVQRACSAGTGCGSCIPQIRRYLDKTVPAGAA
jgi:assimilatory nitrate reductase catalytic subunit